MLDKKNKLSGCPIISISKFAPKLLFGNPGKFLVPSGFCGQNHQICHEGTKTQETNHVIWK